MTSLRFISIILVALLFLLGARSACCPPPCDKEPECGASGEAQAECTYLIGTDVQTGELCRDDSDPINLRNMDREAIVFGDSAAAGYSCYQDENGVQCGFIRELETLLGKEIANFGVATLRSEEPLQTGGWSRKAEVAGRDCVLATGAAFYWVDKSVEKNPEADTVFIHIGGNDILAHVFEDVLNPFLSSIPKPPECMLNQPMKDFLKKIAVNVEQIVARYDQLGIKNVLVGSVAPAEEDSADWCRLGSPLGNAHLCVNEVLERLSQEFASMVTTYNGNAKVYLADHFHEISMTNSDGCEIHCDPIHPNCNGHKEMARVFAEALE